MDWLECLHRLDLDQFHRAGRLWNRFAGFAHAFEVEFDRLEDQAAHREEESRDELGAAPGSANEAKLLGRPVGTPQGPVLTSA